MIDWDGMWDLLNRLFFALCLHLSTTSFVLKFFLFYPTQNPFNGLMLIILSSISFSTSVML